MTTEPGRARSGDDDPPRVDRGPGTAVRWRPGVQLILILVVLLPMLSTGLLTGSGLVSGWAYRQRAQVVARDAAELQVVAVARAQVSALSVPLDAVSYAAGVGISESLLNTLLKPAVPFREQLARGRATVADFPTFSSTPTLRADMAELRAVSLEVAAGTISYTKVKTFLVRMALDVDNLWSKAYDHLQADIASWRPPGSFAVHASALRQTYQAFLAGGQMVEGAALVLEGETATETKRLLIQAVAEYRVATGLFAGQLSPRAQAAWEAMQAKPADRHFAATIQQGLAVALTGRPSPYAGDADFAGATMAPALQYVTDLNNLVVAASQDLHDSALAQASKATRQFEEEIALLVVLALVSLGGVIAAGRVLTRPLRRLAATALQVHDGDFDLERLPDTGPREVATTTRAFNDMASTLKAVESRAVALAAEDFSHPELLVPLPGRTGHALQATIDSLAARIREREQQRQLLHEEATHDGLTGLLNRAAVIDYLTNDVARRRQAGETVAVLFVDLDGLKLLNDTHGHEVGDAAVVVTAEALVESTGRCDVVGRLGGDEFLVVLCHDHSGDGNTVAGRINESLARHSLPVDGDVVPLRASVGVALAHCDADTDPMTLVRQADAAMYESKRAERAARDQLAAARV
jgi:diguanylate cyclase (GGDEF)-like protein